MKRVWICDLLAEEANLVEHGGFVRSNGRFAECVRDDSALASVDFLVDGAGKVLCVSAVPGE